MEQVVPLKCFLMKAEMPVLTEKTEEIPTASSFIRGNLVTEPQMFVSSQFVNALGAVRSMAASSSFQDPPALPLEPILMHMIPGFLPRLRGATCCLQVQPVARLITYSRDTQIHSENNDRDMPMVTQPAWTKHFLLQSHIQGSDSLRFDKKI